ncbi:DUF4296 domain-containing protein [Winogradskyella sp. SYSU M77433]|uniref:DUF4296 domain-containing protein n=1 Tax=Winogradskyella sp. SYSU M77433 TaxID=3042722 RepID=UPI00248145F5|nr:DUF4296 domain-containing protein [Winogradskyella sp. SYSU M77433]MDH7912116.1 DUF4296 domain-containing protein [Winogradskyella sp. SYSU M77433]
MLRKIFVITISLLILGCDGLQKPEKPKDLISKDKMSDILYDMYIINAAKGVNRKLLEKEGVVPETYILTRHNIDSTQFANSNNYYSYDTDVYKSIVEKVKTKLEADKKKYEEIRDRENEEAKERRDSITEVNSKIKSKVLKPIKEDTLILKKSLQKTIERPER